MRKTVLKFLIVSSILACGDDPVCVIPPCAFPIALHCERPYSVISERRRRRVRSNPETPNFPVQAVHCSLCPPGLRGNVPTRRRSPGISNGASDRRSAGWHDTRRLRNVSDGRRAARGHRPRSDYVSQPPADLRAVIDTLAAYRGQWAIAGGWAIDLFLGRTTRPHADVDVAVFRDEQAELRATFPQFEFRLAIDGELVDWERGHALELPLHEDSRSNAVCTIEFLLNDRRDDHWAHRRDPRVERPLSRAIVHSTSCPILAPEIVLLYKSKEPRSTDDADLTNAIPHLPTEARAWLAAALGLSAPGHPWIPLLTEHT